MVLSKKSPYREFFNYQILKMMEVGVMKRLSRSKYLNKNCDKNFIKWKAPTLKKTCSLFLLLFTGFGFSLLCFVMELFEPKWLDRFHKRSKVIKKSEISKELQIIVNKLIGLQAALEYHEIDHTNIKLSLSLLQKQKL